MVEHDDRDLEPFEQHGVVRRCKAEPVGTAGGRRSAQRADLARIDRAFVVERLAAAVAQNGLAQPRQAEEQQEDADYQFERGKGYPADDRGPEAEHDRSQGGQRPRHAGQRRAPRARDADRQHDGERFDGFNRGR